jgi:hypothetical protein
MSRGYSSGNGRARKNKMVFIFGPIWIVVLVIVGFLLLRNKKPGGPPKKGGEVLLLIVLVGAVLIGCTVHFLVP